MGDLLKFDGMTAQMGPSITKWGFEDLGDDPALHRWRAWWATCDIVGGIELRAYPVIKTNYASVWINADGYREHTREGKQWAAFEPRWMKKRLLHNNSGSAWAKPTQEEAIHSLAIRLTRWTNHLARDVEKARSAADALEKLKPDLKMFADTARTRLDGKEWTL